MQKKMTKFNNLIKWNTEKKLKGERQEGERKERKKKENNKKNPA